MWGPVDVSRLWMKNSIKNVFKNDRVLEEIGQMYQTKSFISKLLSDFQ